MSIVPKKATSGNPTTPWGDNLSTWANVTNQLSLVAPPSRKPPQGARTEQQRTICGVTGELLSDHANGIYQNPSRKKPLLSNTGAKKEIDKKPEDAKKINTARALVDYLSCTFRGDDALDRAKFWFGADWSEGKGGYRYKSSLRRGEVTIYHDSNSEDAAGTVHVVARGKGCRQLEEEGLVAGLFPDENATPWQSFLGDLVQAGATFARFDGAIDEYDGRLCLDTIEQYVRNGDCSTRFKYFDPKRPLSPLDGSSLGVTLYFGHRSSNMFVRMYRKDLEQIQKGALAAEVPAGWVRVELEVHDKKADALVRAIISRGMSALVEALWCALDFKDPEHQLKLATDKSKRRTVAWWHDWLEASQKLRLAVDPSIRSVEKLVGWLARAVAPALHVVANAPSAGMGVLYALIESGGERLRETHIAMLLADAISPSKVGYANSYCRVN